VSVPFFGLDTATFQIDTYQNDTFQVGAGSAVYLSGTKAGTISVVEDVASHEVVGRDSLIEQTASNQFSIKLQGFFESGDALRSQILPLLGSTQPFVIPSTAAGRYVYSGLVDVNDFHTGPTAGYGYPYYTWVLNMTTISGTTASIGPFPTGAFQADSFQNDTYQTSG
jgi:hypothetical protein